MYFTTIWWVCPPPITFNNKTRCYVPVFLTILYIHVHVPEYYPPPSLCPLKFLSGTGYYINKAWPTFTFILMATLRSFLYSNAFKTSNWSYLVCRGFRNRCFVNSSIPSATGKSFSPIPESILKSKVFCSDIKNAFALPPKIPCKSFVC